MRRNNRNNSELRQIAQNFGVKMMMKILIATFFISSLSGCSGGISKRKKHHRKSILETTIIATNQDVRAESSLSSQIIDEISPSIPLHYLPANKYPLKPDQVIDLSVSKTGYTRLYMEDERITDVFVYPQEALMVRIHNQGYLIVVPSVNTGADNSGEEKVYLTLTGEKGTTQDLSLRFTGKSPEPVAFVNLDLGNHSIKKGD